MPRDLSITTTVANPSLKKGLKYSFTPVPKVGPIEGTKSRAYGRHSAFAPFFASTWLHSLRYAEVSPNRSSNPFCIGNSPDYRAHAGSQLSALFHPSYCRNGGSM